VLSIDPLQFPDRLDRDGSDEGVLVGKVAVQRRLPDACAASDLVHGDVARLGEHLPGSRKDRLPVAARVASCREMACGAHSPSNIADSLGYFLQNSRRKSRLGSSWIGLPVPRMHKADWHVRFVLG